MNQSTINTPDDRLQQWQWFVFFKDRLLVVKNAEGQYGVPQSVLSPCKSTPGEAIHTVTLNDGHRVKSFSIEQPLLDTDNQMMVDLRTSYEYLPLDVYQAAGKSYQILYWDKHSRFCPACGTRMVQHTDIMKKCPKCGHEMYPPVSTAIIVLIRRGKEVLLVRARNFRGTFYGLVAGFLEAGETLEQCVEREVMEETGLLVTNIRYFASQPWPYPSGLMVGFMADYAGGEIKLQADELTAAAFFTRDNLPELPRKLSIARRLIDYWLEQ